MEKIVIIGHSPAAVTCASVLAAEKPELSIVLISCDGAFPYDRALLPGLISKGIKEKELFLHPEESYKTKNIQVIAGREITRINLSRKKVFLEDKQQVDFDGLVLSDAPQIKFPNYKGVRRSGVFHLSRLETVKSLCRYLAFTETVTLEICGWPGIQAALYLKGLGKEVVVAIHDSGILTGSVSPEDSRRLALLLEARGVRVVESNGIEDILGENEVKAVRLKSGKVLASDMVVLENVTPDFRFMSEGGLVMAERIPVTSAMRTNLPGVYAMDAACQLEVPSYTGSYAVSRACMEQQGTLVARSILGGDLTGQTFSDDQLSLVTELFLPQEVEAVNSRIQQAAAPALAEVQP